MKENILNLVLRRMAESYEQQFPYYEKMYELAVRQDKCLQAEEIDTDLLMELITQRQELINILENISLEIAGLKDEVTTALGINEFTIAKLKNRIEGPGVEKLAESIEELSVLLGKIKEIDKSNEESLRLRIQETSESLSRIQKAKKAKKAYQPKLVTKDGAFIDYSK